MYAVILKANEVGQFRNTNSESQAEEPTKSTYKLLKKLYLITCNMVSIKAKHKRYEIQ